MMDYRNSFVIGGSDLPSAPQELDVESEPTRLECVSRMEIRLSAPAELA
jgi:hypothetical protein